MAPTTVAFGSGDYLVAWVDGRTTGTRPIHAARVRGSDGIFQMRNPGGRLSLSRWPTA